MNCYLFGNQSLTVECAATLLRNGHKIEGVITSASTVREWASSHSVPVLTPETDLVSTLGQRPFDLLLSIAYLSIIPNDVVALPKVAAINFHDGPLPHYAGLNTPAWALINREKSYGITWHLMTGKIDAGDVLLQQNFDIETDETALSLNLKCYQAAIESFAELLRDLEQGQLKRQQQDSAGRNYFAKNDRPAAACTLSWEQDAEAIDAMVRALSFGDYENPLGLPKLAVGSESFVVTEGEMARTASNMPAGSIVAVDESQIQIATTSQDFLITKVMTPEGTPVDLASLLQSAQLKIGDRLPILTSDVVDRLTKLNAAVCRKEAYWVERLSRISPVTLPYTRSCAKKKDKDPGTLDLKLPQEFASSMRSRAGATNRGAFVTAAFAAYLARVAGQTQFDLGIRNVELSELARGAEAVISSHVPVQFSVSPQQSFSEFYDEALRTLDEARGNLSFTRDTPLRYPQLKQLVGAGACGGLPLAVEVVDSFADYLPLDGNKLTVLVSPRDDVMRWHFAPDALTPDDVRRMQNQFTIFLASLAEHPESPLCEMDVLGKEERQRLLVAWNETGTSFPAKSCIHQLFEAQVARTPDSVALAFESSELTYKELNSRVNQLACHLKEKGLKSDDFVGIHLQRSTDMVVAILATLKAGGAYLPLDPEFPADRIRFMLEDTGAPLIVTTSDLAKNLDHVDGQVVQLDSDWDTISSQADDNPSSDVSPTNLAYVIYTSGSTGQPKGVLVEHRNVVNFFTGMDAKISHNPPGVWLAVTSLSFDISVLELLWTLARGFKIVLYSDEMDRQSAPVRQSSSTLARQIDLSLFYFASDESEYSEDKYRLLLEGAKFADANGFSALWTPERHFYAFGGLYPNPSVAGAAIAAITEHIGIRAGSCVLPLHHPIRVAEEWALVDNLSGGRVGISFASGWQPHDFALKPENFADRHKILVEQIDVVKRLWRGEKLSFQDGRGEQVEVRTLPRPVQPELPVWMTAAGNPQTFKMAGEQGFNLLTHLLGQSFEELTEKIAIYRDARSTQGNGSGPGYVTLMLHTFLGDDLDEVREQVRGPMKNYLRSAVGLIEKAAWSFPTFKQATTGKDGGFSLDHLSEEEMDAVLDFAFERYFETSGLFGTPKQCVEMLERIKEIGVDEVSCLIDFGIPTQTVLNHFRHLKILREESARRTKHSREESIPALIARHKVTHLQCTPSMITLLLADEPTRQALGALDQLMIGGEPFPVVLVDELQKLVSGEILNMYGPTETTIWSSVHRVDGSPETVPIGKPIANTQFYVLDDHSQLVPVGVVGELFIGGEGVVRGYHNRPELTSDRFVPDPFSDAPGARLYRTGDLVRYRGDGDLEILGRVDHQVKIRGYRIELGEIEAALDRHADVRESVVVVHEESPGDKRLVAYLRLRPNATPSLASVREFLGATLPDYMIPSNFVRLEAFPLTPNKKIDRKALPPPDQALQLETPRETVDLVPPTNELEGSLRRIWMEVLQVPQVGVEDNFFDLGGHSLLAVQTHRLIREDLAQEVALTDLFRFPTIRSLAQHLEGSQGETVTSSKNSAEKRIAARKRSMTRRRRAKSETETRGDD